MHILATSARADSVCNRVDGGEEEKEEEAGWRWETSKKKPAAEPKKVIKRRQRAGSEEGLVLRQGLESCRLGNEFREHKFPDDITMQPSPRWEAVAISEDIFSHLSNRKFTQKVHPMSNRNLRKLIVL